MKCKHENAEHMMPGAVSTPDWCVQVYAEFEQFRCIDCGEWLSLGPANDTPEVLVEIRAAEIASGGGPSLEHTMNIFDCESCGWRNNWWEPCNPVKRNDPFWAGWLAREIVETP
jgi:predicted RNA-binding Zn-ribbon protein involved in translation (DUF1610 family)